MPSGQFEAIFHRLPDGVIVCDSKGTILQINAAALKLFEVASERYCLGMSYQQFLHAYQAGNDRQQQPLSLEPWLLSLLTNGETPTGQQEEMILLQLPSGRQIYVSIQFPFP